MSLLFSHKICFRNEALRWHYDPYLDQNTSLYRLLSKYLKNCDLRDAYKNTLTDRRTDKPKLIQKMFLNKGSVLF